MAPRIGKDNKAEIQAAVCMGCGSCTAACPAKAISLHHYLDTQIFAAIDSLLGRETAGKPSNPHFLEQVGIAQPRIKVREATVSRE